jgi:hypothetical protein
MEDNNRPQGPGNQPFGQPSQMPQGSGQNSSENTYWESQAPLPNQSQPQQNQGQYQSAQSMYEQQQQGQTNQYTDQTQYQGGYQQYQGGYPGQYQQYQEQPQQSIASDFWTGANANQQTSKPDTPEQFYSYYQQQMSGETPSAPHGQYSQQQYQAGANLRMPKKKSHGKLIAALIVLVILLSGAGTAYAFRDSIINTFSQLTKSPAEYYAYVEEMAIKDSVDSMKPYLNLTSKDTAYDLTTDVTLNRESLDSLLQSSMGISLSDLESQIGVPLESLGMNMYFGYKGDVMNETLGVRFNQVDLITMEMFMDIAKQEMFLRLPELSSAYLEFSGDESISSADLEKLELFNSDKTAELLKRYGIIVVKNLKNVKMEKNYELSVDTISTKCTRLTITVTEEDAANVAKAILEEAKDDEYLIELASMADMTKDDYEEAIEDALDELEDSEDEYSDGSLQMLVYVNDQGEIIGREFSADDTDAAFGYTYLTKDNYNEYEFFINDEYGDKIVSAEGSQTKKDNAYDGSAKIKISDPTEETFGDISIDVNYEDYRTEIKDNHVFQYGTFTISSLDLLGIQVTSESSVEDSTQINKLVFRMGTTPLVTIDSKVEYIKDIDVKMPPKDAEIYDYTQSDSYEATMDLEGYVAKLSEKLGIDLQSLIDSYMYGYDDYGYEDYDYYEDDDAYLDDYDLEDYDLEDYDLEDYDLYDDSSLEEDYNLEGLDEDALNDLLESFE